MYCTVGNETRYVSNVHKSFGNKTHLLLSLMRKGIWYMVWYSTGNSKVAYVMRNSTVRYMEQYTIRYDTV